MSCYNPSPHHFLLNDVVARPGGATGRVIESTVLYATVRLNDLTGTLVSVEQGSRDFVVAESAEDQGDWDHEGEWEPLFDEIGHGRAALSATEQIRLDQLLFERHQPHATHSYAVGAVPNRSRRHKGDGQNITMAAPVEPAA